MLSVRDSCAIISGMTQCRVQRCMSAANEAVEPLVEAGPLCDEHREKLIAGHDPYYADHQTHPRRHWFPRPAPHLGGREKFRVDQQAPPLRARVPSRPCAPIMTLGTSKRASERRRYLWPPHALWRRLSLIRLRWTGTRSCSAGRPAVSGPGCSTAPPTASSSRSGAHISSTFKRRAPATSMRTSR